MSQMPSNTEEMRDLIVKVLDERKAAQADHVRSAIERLAEQETVWNKALQTPAFERAIKAGRWRLWAPAIGVTGLLAAIAVLFGIIPFWTMRDAVITARNEAGDARKLAVEAGEGGRLAISKAAEATKDAEVATKEVERSKAAALERIKEKADQLNDVTADLDKFVAITRGGQIDKFRKAIAQVAVTSLGRDSPVIASPGLEADKIRISWANIADPDFKQAWSISFMASVYPNPYEIKHWEQQVSATASGEYLLDNKNWKAGLHADVRKQLRIEELPCDRLVFIQMGFYWGDRSKPKFRLVSSNWVAGWRTCDSNPP